MFVICSCQFQCVNQRYNQLQMSYEYKGRTSFNKVVFTKPIKQKIEDKLFTEPVRQMFKADSWSIDRYDYDTNKWKLILALIAECPATSLTIESLMNSFILKQIYHIRFVNLKILILNSNLIVSAEYLQYLDAPNLTKLNISKNKLCSVGSIRKTNFPKLQSLIIYSNPITDLSPLSQLLTYQTFINFQIEHFNDEKVSCQNIIWLSKVKPRSLVFYQLPSINRIKQKKIIDLLKSKYPGLITIENESHSSQSNNSQSDSSQSQT